MATKADSFHQGSSLAGAATADAPKDPWRDEHLDYLDALRESGETNMFGARPYLMREFPELSKEDALKVLLHWQDTFPRAGSAA